MSEELISPGTAMEHIGANDFCFMKLYTGTLFNHKTGEPGVFETEYRGLETDIQSRHWLLATAKEVVINAAKKTRTPLHVWTIEFSPLMERYNVPSHLFMNREADRRELGL